MSRIAAYTSGAGTNPSWATNRAARSIRSGSSPNDTSGGDGVRSRPASRSTRPPCGSTKARSGQAQGHRVDREVAPHEVVVEGVPEGDDRLAGEPVVGVGPEGRHLDDGAPPPGADRAELAAHVPRGRPPRRQDALGVVRAGRGREVEVGRDAAEEGVAHRPADEGEVVPGRREPLTEVGEERQDGRQVGDRLPEQAGGGLSGGHEHQGYAGSRHLPAATGTLRAGSARVPDPPRRPGSPEHHWLQ